MVNLVHNMLPIQWFAISFPQDDYVQAESGIFFCLVGNKRQKVSKIFSNVHVSVSPRTGIRRNREISDNGMPVYVHFYSLFILVILYYNIHHSVNMFCYLS